MTSRSPRFFLDTNIFIYTFDSRSAAKQKRAVDLVDDALISHRGIISYQVIQEFLNAASRKFSAVLPLGEAHAYLEQVLMPLCEIYPDGRLCSQALEVSSDMQISFYDALIVTSALLGDCRVLWTEDLQNGRPDRRPGDPESVSVTR
jgi:predicted nucleic acid-binding protein